MNLSRLPCRLPRPRPWSSSVGLTLGLSFAGSALAEEASPPPVAAATPVEITSEATASDPPSAAAATAGSSASEATATEPLAAVAPAPTRADAMPSATATAPATLTTEPPAPEFGIQLAAELGFLAALRHRIQFSDGGTLIDYVDEGGQDVLFPFGRLSATVSWRERTALTLLYQPLDIVTQEVIQRDLRVDDELFTAGTPMRFRYGFPFWRAGIARDVLPSPRHALWLGGALQIRNATIEFASLDGDQLASKRNVGPVPLLSARGRTEAAAGHFLEAEVDGFYAPIKYINGADTDVEGAIVDLSLRAGTGFGDRGELFVNLRYLGGGAEGTGNDDGPGDGFTRNWLHFATLSLGGRLRAL